METIKSEKIEYKGYTIEPEDCPWSRMYGSKFKFSLTDGGERLHSATSIEDAKDQIDDGVCDTANLVPDDWWTGPIADNH